MNGLLALAGYAAIGVAVWIVVLAVFFTPMRPGPSLSRKGALPESRTVQREP